MPDKRRHRGQHPDDARLFSPRQIESLRTAVREYSWLLTHRYAPDSALKLVGDRHELTVRQRQAVRRSSCSDAALSHRAAHEVPLSGASSRGLAVDGYNLLITVESALSGGCVFVGRDGCFRDIASVHGTYRKVEETAPAVRLIIDHLSRCGIDRVRWYLDKPVSNSGRLKALMADELESFGSDVVASWDIVLVDSPDTALRRTKRVVATSDSAVLDDAGAWTNLARDIIRTHVADATLLDLRFDAN